MKKLFFTLTLVFVMILALSFTACKSKNEGGATTSSQQIEELSGQEKNENETADDKKEESSGQEKNENETGNDKKEESSGHEKNETEKDKSMNEDNNLNVGEDEELGESEEIMIPEGPINEMVPEESLELEIEEGQQGALGF